MEFLSIEECDLDGFLANAKMNLANSHPGDALNDVSDFYTEIVGDRHVADLAAWHINSKDYIFISISTSCFWVNRNLTNYIWIS